MKKATIGLLFLTITVFFIFTAVLKAQDTRDAELKASDAELNKVYKTIMMRLSKDDQAKFKAAQLAWIKFRDLDCKWAYVDSRDCLGDRTDDRINELRKTWFMDSSGKYVVVGK